MRLKMTNCEAAAGYVMIPRGRTRQIWEKVCSGGPDMFWDRFGVLARPEG